MIMPLLLLPTLYLYFWIKCLFLIFQKMWVIDWLPTSWPCYTTLPPPLLPNITHIPFPIVSMSFHLPPFLELNQFSKHSYRNFLVVQWLALGVFTAGLIPGREAKILQAVRHPPPKEITPPKQKPKQTKNQTHSYFNSVSVVDHWGYCMLITFTFFGFSGVNNGFYSNPQVLVKVFNVYWNFWVRLKKGE